MGGKTGTTTQSVQIPPEVLARYNSVNAQAQSTASQPFQQYSSDPNAFVAPLNQQQQTGISNINQQANAAQPAYGAAMQGTAQASQGYNAPNYQQGVQAYMNPYLQNAMGSTAAYLQNQNQQQQNQLQGNAISSGAFGGDRGKVAQAALMGQQNLAMGNTLSNMANTGYQQSAQNYMTGLQQQGALANQYGNLAGQAQQIGLAGAQAQLGAGTLGQQTTQAGNTALYNQFQQQQAYPFQVSQFLANIAEGTGALSGSTTTTQQPMSFFSDRRLKHDIKRVGTAENGLPIYKFKYKGDDSEQTHVGFMADEVEKIHPEAVGLAGGYKTVDYDKASEPVHKYAGGLVSEGGAVGMSHAGEGYADGGMPYGGDAPYGGLGYIPKSETPVGKLMTAGPAPDLPESGLAQIGGLAQKGIGMYKDYDWMKSKGMFADGGEVPTKLDIPEDEDKHQLAVAGAPPSSGSGGGLGDIASIAKAAATIAAMFAKDGGRIHKEEGGPIDEQPEITPDYVRNVAAKSAAATGLNPTRPLQIGQLESAFNHNAVGDDGSSFGPWQMHYGNMSEKYPNGGLGDVFTKETGYDLRDPNVRKDPKAIQSNADWVANYMAKNGDRAWSTSRQLGNYPTPPADIPAANAKEAQAATSGLGFNVGKPDNTDVLLSVLSGLGSMAGSKSPFLGSAILEGIGGGAKTYAGLRSQQAEIALRQSEAMKNTMGLMAQRFSPLPDGSFFDAWNNKKVSASERAQAAVEMGLPASFVSGAAGAPQGEQKTIGEAVNGPSQGETPAAPSGVVAPQSSVASPSGVVPPKVETTSAGNGVLPKPETVTQGAAPTTPADAIYAAAEKNPQVVKYNSMADNYLAQAEKLEGEAHQWSQMGRDNQSSALIAQAGALRSQSQQSREIAMKMRDQYAALPLATSVEQAKISGTPQPVYDPDGNAHTVSGDQYLDIVKKGGGVSPDGVPVTATKSPYIDKNVANYGDFSKNAMDFETSYKTDRAALDNLAHVLQNWKAGRGAEAAGELAGLANYYNVPLPKEWQGATTGLDAVTKTATQIAINASAKMAAGAPATNLRETIATSPEAFRDPDALYKNLADRMVAMDISHKMYNDWNDQGQPKNINSYIGDWSKNNKYADFYNDIHGKLGPFAGSTQAGRNIVGAQKPQEQPPAAYPDARKGTDGKFYIPDPNRPGKYMMVQ